MYNIPGSMLMKNPLSSAHGFVFNAPFARSTQLPFFNAADDTGKFTDLYLRYRHS